jgi:BlaI family penicillinase repressor
MLLLMKESFPPSLSASEQEIMDQLWQLAPINILDLLEALNHQRAKPISRATLQTQLTRLENKGWIDRDDTHRIHLYKPAITETRGRKSVLAALKDRFFGGSNLALMRCLVESGDISSSELNELRQIIDNTSSRRKS